MRYLTMITVAVLFLGISGCGFFFGNSDKNLKSKSDVRLKLLAEYRECIDEADDEVKAMECDSYLKEADSIQ